MAVYYNALHIDLLTLTFRATNELNDIFWMTEVPVM